ncbi:hypothetical protein COOONC_06309 [Cooperia oncophora]
MVNAVRGSRQRSWIKKFKLSRADPLRLFGSRSGAKKEEEAAKSDIRRIRGPDGQPIYLTKDNVTKLFGDEQASRIEVFEQLQKSFTPEQQREMNRTGYAVLNPAQREFFYGPSSPYNDSATLDIIRNISDIDVHRTVRDTVRGVADGRLEFESKRGVVKLVTKPQSRRKRAIVLSPTSAIIVNDPDSNLKNIMGYYQTE